MSSIGNHGKPALVAEVIRAGHGARARWAEVAALRERGSRLEEERAAAARERPARSRLLTAAIRTGGTGTM